jgi:DNA repair protein RecO (recombination protein O)
VALVTTECIVLHAFPYGETSRILRILTRTLGVQSVIARGALRPRSRFGGVLEPFTHGSATLYHRPAGDLHTLSAFEVSWNPQPIGADLVRFGGASLIAEIVMRTASEEADAELFDGVSAALRRIADSAPDAVELVVLAECWALIERLGFAPSLEQCVACGRAVPDHEETTFDYTAGGVRCGSCAVGRAGRLLPASARAALVALGTGSAVPLPRTAAHWRLLTRYLAHHVVGDAPLRALDFLGGLVGGGESGGGAGAPGDAGTTGSPAGTDAAPPQAR